MHNLFVDNLSKAMMTEWLRQIIKHHKNLGDVLSRAETTSNMFGFVRYWCREEDLRVIEKLNRVIIRDC